MYICDSWNIKKTEHWRTDVFKLWFCRRLLISNDINLEYSLEGLMLKLKHQYFGHLTGRANSLEKTLILGKIEGMGKRGQQKMRLLDDITESMDMIWSKLQETEVSEAWYAAVHDVTKNQT